MVRRTFWIHESMVGDLARLAEVLGRHPAFGWSGQFTLGDAIRLAIAEGIRVLWTRYMTADGDDMPADRRAVDE